MKKNIYIKIVLFIIAFLFARKTEAYVQVEVDGITYICYDVDIDYETGAIYLGDCYGTIGEVTATGEGGGSGTPAPPPPSPPPPPSGGSSTYIISGYPITKANLGETDFINQIKRVLQDLWCVYIGQLSGEVTDDYYTRDFFDLSGAGKNFDYISERPVYSFDNAKYNFAFPNDPNANFNSISKYFPGNTSAYMYKETNGIQTVDYYGNPIPYPYGIRIFGYNGGKMNIGTLLFSSKSEWESWWDYMKTPYELGKCKY
ncbi:MAG: hypothetical protein ABFS16_16250 [Bacteroidota bacterium]